MAENPDSTRVCPVCGKNFEKTGNRQIYCSENCMRKKNRNTSNTVAHMRDLPTENRYKIYLAYDCKCAICGWQASDILQSVQGRGVSYSYGNEIHHIVPVADGGKGVDGNVILLCPNHHKMAEMGLISRKVLRACARPTELTTDEVGNIQARATEMINELLKTASPSNTVQRNYLKGLAVTSLLAKAGYITLNSLWKGWINDMEQAALDITKQEAENETSDMHD